MNDPATPPKDKDGEYPCINCRTASTQKNERLRELYCQKCRGFIDSEKSKIPDRTGESQKDFSRWMNQLTVAHMKGEVHGLIAKGKAVICPECGKNMGKHFGCHECLEKSLQQRFDEVFPEVTDE